MRNTIPTIFKKIVIFLGWAIALGMILIAVVFAFCVFMMMFFEYHNFERHATHGVPKEEREVVKWIKQRKGDYRIIGGRVGHVIKIWLPNDSTLTNEDLDRMKVLTHLQWLDVSKTNITNAAIPYINQIPSLRKLNISGTKVTDEGLLELILPNLEVLNVKDTEITNDGLVQLTQSETPFMQHWSARTFEIIQDDSQSSNSTKRSLIAP